MHKKLADPDRLCMGCMEELAQPAARCPRCGFDERKYERPDAGAGGRGCI